MQRAMITHTLHDIAGGYIMLFDIARAFPSYAQSRRPPYLPPLPAPPNPTYTPRYTPLSPLTPATPPPYHAQRYRKPTCNTNTPLTPNK